MLYPGFYPQVGSSNLPGRVIPACDDYNGYKGYVRQGGEGESKVDQTATALVFPLVREEAAQKAARVACHLA
jgi:hypothetical protein